MEKTEKTEPNVQNKNIGENVCNFTYMVDLMSGKKNLIKDMLETFLKEIPEELKSINDAVLKTDYPAIRRLSHNMKSSVSIMGLSTLKPVLEEMQSLSEKAIEIDKIKGLNQQLNLICKKAMDEVEKEMLNYA